MCHKGKVIIKTNVTNNYAQTSEIIPHVNRCVYVLNKVTMLRSRRKASQPGQLTLGTLTLSDEMS